MSGNHVSVVLFAVLSSNRAPEVSAVNAPHRIPDPCGTARGDKL